MATVTREIRKKISKSQKPFSVLVLDKLSGLLADMEKRLRGIERHLGLVKPKKVKKKKTTKTKKKPQKKKSKSRSKSKKGKK